MTATVQPLVVLACRSNASWTRTLTSALHSAALPIHVEHVAALIDAAEAAMKHPHAVVVLIDGALRRTNNEPDGYTSVLDGMPSHVIQRVVVDSTSTESPGPDSGVITVDQLTADLAWQLCVEASRRRSALKAPMSTTHADTSRTAPTIQRGVLIATLHDDDVVRTNLSIHLALAAQTLTGFGSTVLVDGARLATIDSAAVDHVSGPTLRDITESARWATADKDISIGSITLGMGRKTAQIPLIGGMRSAASWLTLTDDVADAAISRLCDVFGASVVTSEASLDGRRESGSLDIEERNVLPRLLARCADVLVVATRANPIAIQRWRETMSTITALRSDTQPVVSVVLDAPKNPATRASIQNALVNATDRPVTVAFDDVGLSARRRNDVGMVDGTSVTKLGGVLDAVLRDLVERPTRGQDPSHNVASSAQSA